MDSEGGGEQPSYVNVSYIDIFPLFIRRGSLLSKRSVLLLTKHRFTITNKTEYVVHKLNFGSHYQPIQIKKQSDQSKSPSNQLHKCETKKWKGFRVSKIGNVEVLRILYSLLFTATLPTLTSLCALCSWEHREIFCALCSLGSKVCEV